MIILTRSEIEALINLSLAAEAIEEAYRATSQGRVNLPPVGHITFPDYGGDCHIKYGHLLGDPTFVIKVATGFPGNPALSLETGGGVVLVLSAETGEVRAVLHDEMMLTDIRTGLGGAIASRLLARPNAQRVLIVGAGMQAKYQVEAHAALLPNKPIFEVWGRCDERATSLVRDLETVYDVSHATNLEEATGNADIVVTVTGATTPFLMSNWVPPGCHITAVGADAPGKQELETKLVERADVLVADYKSQCLDHGEFSHAARSGACSGDGMTELGHILLDASLGRTEASQITIADLTGIAAQDIAIANFILNAQSD